MFLTLPFGSQLLKSAFGSRNRSWCGLGRICVLARLRRRLLLARAGAILLYGWLRLPHRLDAFFRDLRAAKSSLDRLLSEHTPAHQRDAHALVAWLDRRVRAVLGLLVVVLGAALTVSGSDLAGAVVLAGLGWLCGRVLRGREGLLRQVAAAHAELDRDRAEKLRPTIATCERSSWTRPARRP